MPINPNLLAGLSNATVPTVVGANQPASGYNFRGNPDETIQQEIDSQSVRVHQFPTDLPRYHFVITENSWGGFGNRTLTAQRQFRLQLPTPLTDGFEVDYDQNFSYLGELKDRLGAVFGAGAAIGQAVGAATGLQLNVFKTVTMSAPKYRSFDFTWKFSPKNFQEAQEIRRITTYLRKGMSPKTFGNSGTQADKLVLEFPQIYTMHFFNNVRYLYKFKPCVLTALAVDYQGGNPFPGFYKGNENPPESIVMSTKWLELEYWLQSDIKENDGIPTNLAYDAFNYYTTGESDGRFTETTDPQRATTPTPDTDIAVRAATSG